MIYLIHGNDTEKARKRFRDILNGFVKKNPNSSVSKVDADSFDVRVFNELSQSRGLFSEKNLIVCDNILKNKEAEEFLNENLKNLADSENIFLILEEKEGEIKKFAKNCEEFPAQGGPASDWKKEYNVFAITDVFGESNRKKLWVEYHKALRAGMEADFDVFWKLIWQLKMMFVAVDDSAGAGRAIEKLKIKPYTLSKARAYARNFQKEDLKRMFGDLVRIYHDNRRGIGDYELSVERFILNLPKKSVK